MNSQEIGNAATKIDGIAKQHGVVVACREVGIDDIGDVKYAVRQRCLRYIVENSGYEFQSNKTTPIALTAEDKLLLDMMVNAATDGFILGVATKMGLKSEERRGNTYLLN